MSKSSRRRTGAPSATPAPDGGRSHSPTGTPRAGRRERARPHPERSFLERYRNLLLGAAVVIAVVLVGGFVFVSAASPAYACGTESQAPDSPDASTLGFAQDDMGRQHVPAGQFVRYTFCPPASGNHINKAGQGPIEARLYGPGDVTEPQGWIHNLEHGGLVVLYRCDGGGTGCDQANQDAMKAFLDTFPNSPVCGVPKGRIGPVIARFEQMPARYAALVWGRVLYLDTFDTQTILDFFAKEGERGNPEPQCSIPSPSPGASASPAVSPSPAASSPSSSPSTPGSPAASPSPS